MESTKLPLLIEELNTLKIEHFNLQKSYPNRKSKKYLIKNQSIISRAKALKHKIDILGKRHNIVQLNIKRGDKRGIVFYTDISIEDARSLAIRDIGKDIEILKCHSIKPGNFY